VHSTDSAAIALGVLMAVAIVVVLVLIYVICKRKNDDLGRKAEDVHNIPKRRLGSRVGSAFELTDTFQNQVRAEAMQYRHESIDILGSPESSFHNSVHHRDDVDDDDLNESVPPPYPQKPQSDANTAEEAQRRPEPECLSPAVTSSGSNDYINCKNNRSTASSNCSEDEDSVSTFDISE
jgi:hypothetical protein